MGQETRAHPSGLTLLELPGFHLGEKVQVAPPMVAGLKSAPTQPIICPSVARGQQGPGDDPLVDARTDVHGPIRSGFREARASATLEASGFRRDQRFAEREPVDVVRDGKRLLWWFHDCFYWDDDGLAADDIKALVLQRERRLQQKLQTAHSLMRAEEAGRPTRIPIPTELRRAVFERDGGCCVECGSNFDLQYDHLLPVAHGGATTVENLQLLCADCNRRKSDNL